MDTAGSFTLLLGVLLSDQNERRESEQMLSCAGDVVLAHYLLGYSPVGTTRRRDTAVRLRRFRDFTQSPGSSDVNPLYRQAIVQGVFGLVFFVAIVFGTAGTWDYWQGWLFLAAFAASTTGFTIYLARYDKPLLERRMKAGPWHEQQRSQQIIVSLIFVAFFAFIILPILDYRHGLSRVPAWVSIVGDAIIILSYLGIFWVVKTNSWAASNIRVEAGQKVIDSGPYAYVRHPMYAAAVWLFVGMPLALGSWWSIALLIPFFPVLLWRLLDEEKILARDLPGYAEYMRRVKYRLAPHVW